MSRKPIGIRSKDRKYIKYEYSRHYRRDLSPQKKYDLPERFPSYREGLREHRHRDESRINYGIHRSHDVHERDGRSYDRRSVRRGGRENYGKEIIREERLRADSERETYHRYIKQDSSSSPSIRKRYFKSRSVSLGHSDGRRTPPEPVEKVSVPIPPGGGANSASITSKSFSSIGKDTIAPETTPSSKQVPNITRTLTVMRDGKVIPNSTVLSVTNLVSVDTTVTDSVTATASVKVENEVATKPDPNAAVDKDVAKNGNNGSGKAEEVNSEGLWKGFPIPKFYKKLDKFYDPLPKYGVLTPNLYFPLDGAKLRRYKAYKPYNDKLSRYVDRNYYKNELVDLLWSDYKCLKRKIELLELESKSSQLCF